MDFGKDGFFEPTDDKRVRRLVREAHKTNLARDIIDRQSGGRPPDEEPVDVFLRTVISALECGLATKDEHPIAEGIAMLQSFERELRAEFLRRATTDN